MVDTLNPSRRSENMRRIGSKNTSIELTARRLVRELGFTGYRIHRGDLPGKPDIAWIGRRLAINVHGCFWHQHDCKEGLRRPKSNAEYWTAKIDRNVQRDQEHVTKLQSLDWQVLTIWECEFRDIEQLRAKLAGFLMGAVSEGVIPKR